MKNEKQGEFNRQGLAGTCGFMSEETEIKSEKLKQFIAEDSYNTEKEWKELKACTIKNQ